MSDISTSEPTLTQKLAAETIGTCILVVIGCGSVAMFAAAGDAASFFTTTTTVALAFGLAVLFCAYSFGRVSGGHFNPAVSVGAAISGRLSWLETGYYAAAQVVGAIVGAFILFIITMGFGYNSFEDGGVGANGFGDDASGIDWWAAGLLEIVLTAIFVFVILAVTDSRNQIALLAPLAIGLTLTGVHFVGIPATGTSVNPARSIGPALFSGGESMADLWLFIVAPLVGALLAGIAYPAIFGRGEAPVAGSGLNMPERPEQTTPAGPTEAPNAFQRDAEADATATQVQPAVSPEPEGESRPSWQQPKEPAKEGELPVYEQDGWRWDYAKQQWVPIDDQ